MIARALDENHRIPKRDRLARSSPGGDTDRRAGWAIASGLAGFGTKPVSPQAVGQTVSESRHMTKGPDRDCDRGPSGLFLVALGLPVSGSPSDGATDASELPLRGRHLRQTVYIHRITSSRGESSNGGTQTAQLRKPPIASTELPYPCKGHGASEESMVK